MVKNSSFIFDRRYHSDSNYIMGVGKAFITGLIAFNITISQHIFGACDIREWGTVREMGKDL